MIAKGIALFLVAFGATVGNCLARAQDARPAAEISRSDKHQTLSPEDRQLLERLLKEFIFDPQGAKYVDLTMNLHDVAGGYGKITRQGWLIAGSAGQAGHFYFAGEDEFMIVPQGAKATDRDFTALCRDRYESKTPSDAPNPNAIGGPHEFEANLDLVNAAWLYRLGKNELAFEAIERARKHVPNPIELSETPAAENSDVVMVAGVQENLAAHGYQRMIRDFTYRADGAVVAEDRRLLKLYPKPAAQLAQCAAIVADLDRRRRMGSFGKGPPDEWPTDYDSWATRKKLGYLIESLDEVDAQREGFGYGGLLTHRIIAALLDLGDVAIPKLIDTIENDNRLTRCVEDSLEQEPQPMVLSVRQAAFVAAMGILRIQVFGSDVGRRALTLHEPDDRIQIVRILREYWKAKGELPFEARMMEQLTDAKGECADWRAAAYNLAYPQSRRMTLPSKDAGEICTIKFPIKAPDGAAAPKPALANFSNPTVAEAMLAAMDRELATYETESAARRATDPSAKLFLASVRKPIEDPERRTIEDAYLLPLMELHDPRIAAELAQRYQVAKFIRSRCQLALAAHGAGEPEPLKQLCCDFRLGRLELPRINKVTEKLDGRENLAFRQGLAELFEIIATLVDSHSPDADAALFALARPEHPQNKIAIRLLLANWWGVGLPVDFPPRRDFDDILDHPYFLAVLRPALDDKAPTGTAYRGKSDAAKGDTLTLEKSGGGCSESSVNYVQDWGPTRERAEERVCDAAADVIRQYAWGMPLTHPLLKDEDARLATMKETLDHYRKQFRLATKVESESIANFSRPRMLIPVWKPLGRPATADDVASGIAIFQLAGRGKVAPITLPAVGTFTNRSKGGTSTPEKVLILQAEVGADGKTLYGIVRENCVQSMPADKLSDIRPITYSPAK